MKQLFMPMATVEAEILVEVVCQCERVYPQGDSCHQSPSPQFKTPVKKWA